MTSGNVRYTNSNALSKHFWLLKNGDNSPIIMWDIVAKAKSYNGKGNRCNLCLVEKLAILKHLNNLNLLNKR